MRQQQHFTELEIPATLASLPVELQERIFRQVIMDHEYGDFMRTRDSIKRICKSTLPAARYSSASYTRLVDLTLHQSSYMRWRRAQRLELILTTAQKNEHMLAIVRPGSLNSCYQTTGPANFFATARWVTVLYLTTHERIGYLWRSVVDYKYATYVDFLTAMPSVTSFTLTEYARIDADSLDSYRPAFTAAFVEAIYKLQHFHLRSISTLPPLMSPLPTSSSLVRLYFDLPGAASVGRLLVAGEQKLRAENLELRITGAAGLKSARQLLGGVVCSTQSLSCKGLQGRGVLLPLLQDCSNAVALTWEDLEHVCTGCGDPVLPASLKSIAFGMHADAADLVLRLADILRDHDCLPRLVNMRVAFKLSFDVSAGVLQDACNSRGIALSVAWPADPVPDIQQRAGKLLRRQIHTMLALSISAALVIVAIGICLGERETAQAWREAACVVFDRLA